MYHECDRLIVHTELSFENLKKILGCLRIILQLMLKK